MTTRIRDGAWWRVTVLSAVFLLPWSGSPLPRFPGRAPVQPYMEL